MTIAICGAEDWVAIAAFGEAKEAWLSTFLALPNGIPSDDTFRRVFEKLDPQAFQSCFISWVQGVSQMVAGERIALGRLLMCVD